MGYLGIPCITFFDNYWKQFSFAKKVASYQKIKMNLIKFTNLIIKVFLKMIMYLKVYSFLIENSKRNIYSKKNF